MTTITIPLNKLRAWDGNVRKTDADKGIDELAASIAAHGLLQSLVARKDKRGKYAVVAGRRRLLALNSLVSNGTIDADRPIPCHVIDDEADATEVSLAENVQREAMHPADECDAFKALIESGMPVADVAARFGVTETVVQKRLKLAQVSPVLIAAYRRAEIALQHVMAFAASSDHAAQERVWNELPAWRKDDPDAIRAMLLEGEITADDRRVRFVTLEAYEQAGGTVRRDLFSDDKDGLFIDDVVLLERLIAQKLERIANEVRNEGWKWVEIRDHFDFAEWSDCKRRSPERAPLAPEQQEELDTLSAEADALEEIDERDEEQEARLDDLADRIDAVNESALFWPTETLAIAGTVVALGANGEADIRHGLVKPEDASRQTAKGKEAAPDGGTSEAGPSPLPAALIESLTAHRSAALNAALLERGDVALAVLVHAIALPVFYNGSRGESVLQVTASDASLHRVEGARAHQMIEAARDVWSRSLPGDGSDLHAWCLQQESDTLQGLLTFCVAQTVNAVLSKSERPDSRRMAHAAQVSDALQLAMTDWFAPTAANYFSRVSKAAIIEALREAKGDVAPAWAGMKKADLAALAERELAGTGWLPEPLRAQTVTCAEADMVEVGDQD